MHKLCFFLTVLSFVSPSTCLFFIDFFRPFGCVSMAWLFLLFLALSLASALFPFLQTLHKQVAPAIFVLSAFCAYFFAAIHFCHSICQTHKPAFCSRRLFPPFSPLLLLHSRLNVKSQNQLKFSGNRKVRPIRFTVCCEVQCVNKMCRKIDSDKTQKWQVFSKKSPCNKAG